MSSSSADVSGDHPEVGPIDDEEASPVVEPGPGSVTPGARSRAWAVAAVVTLATTAALTYAFMPGNAGNPVVIGTIGATYFGLTVASVIWMRRRGELVQRLAPRRLDITVGALLATVLYLLATVVHTFVTSSGPRMGWIMRIYVQIGDTRATSSFAVGLVVLLVAAAEEIVWRGWVLGALSRAYRARKAWLITSGLYAVAHLTTVYLLRDPMAGPNPLLVTAAAGCGLVWGYLAMKVDRVAPSVFAHALFTWGVVEFPLFRM
jgi:membrane protease YdiL (CAAX protease family)